MKLVAIMPARNEDWVLGLSLRALLMWVDEVVVLNHCSTDDTQQIIEDVANESGGKVTSLYEGYPVWEEMRHRQLLLEAARNREATHIAILDADEIVTGHCLSHMRGWVEKLAPGTVLRGPMRHCHRGLWQFRRDGSVWCRGGYYVSIAFADAPALKWQARKGYDHHSREPEGARLGGRITDEHPAVMHLQFAHWRRLRAKHALYKMTERVRWPNKSVGSIDQLYSMALDETRLGTHPVPPAWWEPYKHLMKHLRIDQSEMQWQERECARLMSEHGPDTFKGLNLFGVA